MTFYCRDHGLPTPFEDGRCDVIYRIEGYPTLARHPSVDWGPGFEGPIDMPNEFSADAAMLVNEVTVEGSKTIASIQIVLAKREGVSSRPEHSVGIELTANDVLYLARELNRVYENRTIWSERQTALDAVNTPGAHYIDGDGEEWVVGEHGNDVPVSD